MLQFSRTPTSAETWTPKPPCAKISRHTLLQFSRTPTSAETRNLRLLPWATADCSASISAALRRVRKPPAREAAAASALRRRASIQPHSDECGNEPPACAVAVPTQLADASIQPHSDECGNTAEPGRGEPPPAAGTSFNSAALRRVRKPITWAAVAAMVIAALQFSRTPTSAETIRFVLPRRRIEIPSFNSAALRRVRKLPCLLSAVIDAAARALQFSRTPTSAETRSSKTIEFSNTRDRNFERSVHLRDNPDHRLCVTHRNARLYSIFCDRAVIAFMRTPRRSKLRWLRRREITITEKPSVSVRRAR